MYGHLLLDATVARPPRGVRRVLQDDLDLADSQRTQPRVGRALENSFHRRISPTRGPTSDCLYTMHKAIEPQSRGLGPEQKLYRAGPSCETWSNTLTGYPYMVY